MIADLRKNSFTTSLLRALDRREKDEEQTTVLFLRKRKSPKGILDLGEPRGQPKAVEITKAAKPLFLDIVEASLILYETANDRAAATNSPQIPESAS